jgi:hypothetical protein
VDAEFVCVYMRSFAAVRNSAAPGRKSRFGP